MRPSRPAATHDTMPIAQSGWPAGGVTAIGTGARGSRGADGIISASAAFCASIRARSSGVRLLGFCAASGAARRATMRRRLNMMGTLPQSCRRDGR